MTRPLDARPQNQELALSRSDGLDDLLIEAASLSRNWKNQNFRDTAAREAEKTFLPPAAQIGTARFQIALALRAAMRAMPQLTDDARAQAAIALAALVAALRKESAAHANRPTPASAALKNSSRVWWTD